jgi:SSS family solute:Na+ symporter
VIVALYWPKTTRQGMIAGIAGSQLFYLLHVFLPALTVGGVTVFGSTYFTWDFALYGMALSLLLTVGVSLLTTADADERAETFTVGTRAD